MNFIWSPLPEDKHIAVEIQADPDVGKTYFCAHACAKFDDNGKILEHHAAVGDTEFKADIEMIKIQNPFFKKLHTFQDVRDFVYHCIKNPKIEAICIDSGSDLRAYAEQEFLDETGQKRVFPLVLFGRVFAKIDKLMKDIHDAGKHLVVTSRLKDEYADDERTGRRIRDSYKKFPYQLPMMIHLQYGIRDSKGKIWFSNHIFGEVVKNNWWKKFKEKPDEQISKPWLFDVSFKGIMFELVENPWDGIDIIASAHQFLHDNNIDHDETGVDQLPDLE